MKINREILLSLLACIIISWERRDFKIVAKAETGNATEIMATSAKVSGNLVDLGEEVSDYGHCWALTSQPTVQNYRTSFGKADKLCAIVSIMNSLERGKIYHVRAYLASGKEVFYGDDVQFTTQNGQAVITTNNVTSITSNSVSSGGNVVSDMYDNSLLPIAVVNKLVSLSNHPSAVLLEKFAKASI
ncbi:MAG: hypothetical protein ACM3RX_07490 [Methanococcaceae archaeon]